MKGPRDHNRTSIFVMSLKPAENSIMLQWAWVTFSLVFCSGSRLAPVRYLFCSWSFGSVRARVRESWLVGQRANPTGASTVVYVCLGCDSPAQLPRFQFRYNHCRFLPSARFRPELPSDLAHSSRAYSLHGVVPKVTNHPCPKSGFLIGRSIEGTLLMDRTVPSRAF
jgi:hypothetical protein